MKDKLLIIGLDCASPQLILDKWLDDLPNLKALVKSGVGAVLWSTIPPITVPAWTSMMTSKDAGQLGIYGFRNRSNYGYEALYFANSLAVKEKTVWNYLSRHRLFSIIFGLPQTYPPKPLNGIMVGCFLTPDKKAEFTYPPEVKEELDKYADGDYIIDVKDFRTENKDWLLEQIVLMTRRRFKAFRHFYTHYRPDFAIIVEMGVDRMHHGFWRFFDQQHRLYQPGNRFENVIYDYYRLIDEEIGKTLELVDHSTSIMVVSDHGAKGMQGAICINEWLQRKGWLYLKDQPKGQQPLKLEMIDWSRTKVWGEGGYYSRLFFNVQGREPQGVIPQSEYEAFRDKVIAALEEMTDEQGKLIHTRAFKPQAIYRQVRNIPPDLIVYLGDLNWRSAGSVGTGRIHLYENDTGPDDANHSEDGLFIWDLPKEKLRPINNGYSIYDIAPTILSFFNLEIPEDMIGKSILKQGEKG